jgi:hypothetical protein
MYFSLMAVQDDGKLMQDLKLVMVVIMAKKLTML